MGGVDSATIPHNASASAVQAALNGIAGITGAVVTGSAGGPYSITFTGPQELEKGAITLTGGTDPDITIT